MGPGVARAPSPKAELPSNPERHKACTSQLANQFWILPESGDKDFVLVQPC